MVMEGRRIVLTTALILNFVGLVCLFVAFASPYWVVSWPRVYSGFKKTGLWETCFAGLVLERDPTQKAYHGCWWILAPEYKRIREWIMPWWFIITQIVITCTLLMEICAIIILFYIYKKTGKDAKSGVGKQQVSFKMVQTTTIITIVSAILKACTVILFGVAVYKDRMWMPDPHLNYMSWSYGLAIISTFFSIFSSIAHVVFSRITKQAYYEPPSMAHASFASTSNFPEPQPFKDATF